MAKEVKPKDLGIYFDRYDGQNGVNLDGLLFLFVDRHKGKWGFKLYNQNLNESLTGWMVAKSPLDLRRPRKFGLIRKYLENLYGKEDVDEAIEKIIIEIDRNLYEFEDHGETGKAEEKPKEETKASGLSDQGYFELIVDDDFEPCFLVYKNGRFTIQDSLRNGSHVYVPKALNQIPYKPYHYFNDPLPSPEEIYRMVYGEFDLYLDLDDIWKHILSSCVLLTYQQDKVLTVPYLYAYGDNESGKTTILNVMNELCYRPMFGITIPSADLYGYLEDADCIPTILEDEIQGIDKDTDKIKIYKSGYKKGAVVPRTVMLEHDRVIRYYRTFCFKAVASEKIPTVKGFVERFIFIPMIQGYPKKEWTDNDAEDFERFRRIRNILLKWRLVTREQQLSNLELSFKGRVKELWKPLLQVTYGLKVHDIILKFIEDQIKQRIETRQNTLEGHIVKVVGECYEGKPITFDTIWFNLLHDLEGKIDDKKEYVMHTPEFNDITKRLVGFRLRELLDGQRKTMRVDGKPTKCWIFNAKKLVRVLRKYGYDSLVTKLPMLPISEGISPLFDVLNEEKEAQNEPLSSKEARDNITKNAYTPLEVGNNGNIGNSKITSLPFTVEEIREIRELHPALTGWCDYCNPDHKKPKKVLRYKVVTYHSEFFVLCGDCGQSVMKRMRERNGD